jgi:hypothetical protein
MRSQLTALAVAGGLLLIGIPMRADVMRFDYVNVGSYHGAGLMDLFNLGTFNGQPITETNKPTDSMRELSATVNLFVSRSDPHALFVQVTDVVTSRGMWFAGSAMDAPAFSGIRFWLPATSAIVFGTATFSDNYANPGQVLFTGNGTETIPLSDTPGWIMDSLAANGAYYVHTSSGTDYSLGTWGWVNGTHRIMGGGIFELCFSSSIDLFRDVDFRDVDMDFIYGNGLQQISADWIPSTDPPVSTPEPSAFILFGTVVLALVRWNKPRTLE